eukprot:CAMPEP_0180614414 /NCGR_PEP_ID=MMETSP1037_2-20121125/31402_1 /TAXON_ID=632150 /ORGANISM="Azadinium spinosum, Strain 3D9" /LENGTH=180 /DNA_ID=CAMNT_0022634121 /DNA_START=42 /DNA_END=580 /DNA_ORIENTATION=-
MSWDRGAPTPVVMNSHQEKQAGDTGPPWLCSCGFSNTSTCSHCKECGLLKPEERAMRLQARAIQGMGRGGGYFERSDPSDRREITDDVDTGLDIYGRRRSVPAVASGATAASAAEAPPEAAATGGPRNSLTPNVAVPSKAERQRAALERLRNPSKKKETLSPPRGRTFRELSSRSRSREA